MSDVQEVLTLDRICTQLTEAFQKSTTAYGVLPVARLSDVRFEKTIQDDKALLNVVGVFDSLFCISEEGAHKLWAHYNGEALSVAEMLLFYATNQMPVSMVLEEIMEIEGRAGAHPRIAPAEVFTQYPGYHWMVWTTDLDGRSIVLLEPESVPEDASRGFGSHWFFELDEKVFHKFLRSVGTEGFKPWTPVDLAEASECFFGHSSDLGNFHLSAEAIVLGWALAGKRGSLNLMEQTRNAHLGAEDQLKHRQNIIECRITEVPENFPERWQLH